MATGDVGTWAAAITTTKGTATATATMETISLKEVVVVGEEVIGNPQASTIASPLANTVDAIKTCHLMTLELSTITTVIEMTIICPTVAADKAAVNVLAVVIIITMTRGLAQ